MPKAFTFALLLAAAVHAQSPPLFRSNVELVAIPVSVLDAEGRPVTGIERSEFRVFDNGSRRIVENLWLDTDLPLTLGIIIDTSDSQHDQLAEHRETAAGIIKQLLRPGDQSFVISAGEEVRLWSEMSSSLGPLFGEPCPQRQSTAPGVRPVSACGSSPLWNAVYDAARLKLRNVPGSKALLVLTDGFDSGSTHTWQQAAAEAQKSESTVYAIQYPSAFGGKYAPDLARLVAETGGAVFQAPRGQYAGILSRLEADLRGRYVLGFRPEKQTGKLRHEVVVEVTRPGVTVRARKTYFVPTTVSNDNR